MENRASYTIVGAFVLALVAGLFVFVVWLAKVQLEGATTPYRIYFTGTVTGLVEGSPVRYRGVAVGTVSDIRLDPDNVERVRVTVEVPEGTPIKTDAVASLEPVGVTGGVYVEIAGGSRDAPLLDAPDGGIPVIPSRPSSIAEVLAQAPQLLGNLIAISEKVSTLLNDDNQRAFAAILGNLAAASDGANAAVRSADQLVVELRGEVKTVSRQASQLLGNANKVVAGVGADVQTVAAELAKTSRDLTRLTASMATTAEEVRQMVHENREPIRDFTSETLYEFGALTIQLQDLAANLSRVTSRLERDPSQLIFGTSRTGVEVK